VPFWFDPFSEKFNDWLLSFGTLPQAWLEKYGLD